ncbi:RbsD/FucU family protein [Pelagibius sp. Alg239-R121]|uniref:RbsD/FucU family protein n=1 Tax=Pelagibius sp. Alg239-R121 TaxID=2993448 RepID=UPI0024A6778F|nr:RbsD/FucU domain-containing protein [Pelagibius sp. Alg239-R121]
MLKTIPSIISADLLWVLRAMGHGDVLTLADRNFPAATVAKETTTGRLVQLNGVDDTEAAKAILQLYPLDSFIDTPVYRMEVVDKPDELLEVHQDIQAACDAAEGREIQMGSIERFAFYEAAKKSFAVVQTTEDRPYGCFLLTKGVVFD